MYAYADDLALVNEGESEDKISTLATNAVERVARWMKAKGLKMAVEESEAVVLIGRRKIHNMQFPIGNEVINTRERVRYLEVVLDRNMRMASHVQYVKQKAAKLTSDLARLMLNMRGPKSSKRKLYVSATMSILLYAALV